MAPSRCICRFSSVRRRDTARIARAPAAATAATAAASSGSTASSTARNNALVTSSMAMPTNCVDPTAATSSTSCTRAAQLAGHAMQEVADRQAEEVRQQALRPLDGQPYGQALQTALLQPRQQVQRARRGGGGQREEAPARLSAAEHLVDEEAQQQGQREARQDHQQPARHRERQRRLDVAQPRPELAHDAAGPRAAGLEVRSRLQLQHDSGELLVELLRADAAAAVGGIVQVRSGPARSPPARGSD